MTPLLRLRMVEQLDAPLLLEWRNDAHVRRNSLSSAAVGEHTHYEWLADKLASPDCRFWILERDGCAIGQIRFDRSEDDAFISFSVATGFRGQGLGSELLELSADRACKELRVQRLVGIVKRGNSASLNAFKRARFIESTDIIEQGVLCVKMERSCEPCLPDLKARVRGSSLLHMAVDGGQ